MYKCLSTYLSVYIDADIDMDIDRSTYRLSSTQPSVHISIYTFIHFFTQWHLLSTCSLGRTRLGSKTQASVFKECSRKSASHVGIKAEAMTAMRSKTSQENATA